MKAAATPVCEAVTSCANVINKANCGNYTIGTATCIANTENTTCSNLT